MENGTRGSNSKTSWMGRRSNKNLSSHKNPSSRNIRTSVDSWLLERSSILSDNTHLSSTEPSKLYCHPEEFVLVFLVIRRERVLMKDNHIVLLSTRPDEIR